MPSHAPSAAASSAAGAGGRRTRRARRVVAPTLLGQADARWPRRCAARERVALGRAEPDQRDPAGGERAVCVREQRLAGLAAETLLGRRAPQEAVERGHRRAPRVQPTSQLALGAGDHQQIDRRSSGFPLA